MRCAARRWLTAALVPLITLVAGPAAVPCPTRAQAPSADAAAGSDAGVATPSPPPRRPVDEPVGRPARPAPSAPASTADAAAAPRASGDAGAAHAMQPTDGGMARDAATPAADATEPEAPGAAAEPGTEAATTTPAGAGPRAPADAGAAPGGGLGTARAPRVPAPSAGEPSKLWELLRDLVPVLPRGRAGGALWLAALAVLALLAATGVRRIRERLPATGALPRLLAVVHTLLRLAGFVLVLVVVARLLPGWMGPALPWVLLAAAAALGWSARDVLPDAVAGIVLTFERRVRRGVWIAGEGFAGTVERVGLRATWLVDGRGHRIAVPNRRMVGEPIVSDSAVGAEHEVRVRMSSTAPASLVRRSLADAVLMSPWVPPGRGPVVLRDPDDPEQWIVRSALLEVRYAAQFEGELLERAEEVLAHQQQRHRPPDEAEE